MIELLEKGEGDKIVRDKRLDETKQSTQKNKRNANDYRYFPDPDLPKLFLSEIFDIEKLK